MDHRRFRLALAAASSCAGAALAGAPGGLPADAAEPIRVEALRIEPRAPAPAGRTPVAAYAALSSKPPGWTAGGPAVVVLWEEPGRDDLRDRIVDAVLDEGAAVLELDAHSARGVSPDSALSPPPPTPQELLPDLFAALDALRRDARAGAEIAAVGYGAAGAAAALLAADEPTAAAHLGSDGPRFAGLAALGPGRPAFALGAPPPPAAAEGWGLRALRFCGALAAAFEREAVALAKACAGAFVPRSPDGAATALAARADPP